MKKLLFLCSYKAPYGGNFVPSLCALEARLKKNGIECVYCFDKQAVSRQWYKSLEADGKVLVPMDFSAGVLSQWRQLNDIVKDCGADTVYAHFGSQLLTGIYAALHPSKKVVWHIHSDFSMGRKPSFKKKLQNFINFKLLASFVKTFCVSKNMAQSIRGGIYVPNALCLDRPSPEKTADEIRAELAVGDSTLALMFAWSPEVKGLDIAALATKMLSERKNVVLAAVCGREMTEEKLKLWLREHTELDGNESFLRFLPPVQNVFEYINACDLFISASRSEGFSASVLEAASAEKPCLSSDIAAVIGWAGELPLVYPFKSESPEDCARMMESVIDNPPSDEQKKKTRAIIDEKYSIECWSEDLAKLLVSADK